MRLSLCNGGVQKAKAENYPKRCDKTVNDVAKIQEVPDVAYFKA